MAKKFCITGTCVPEKTVNDWSSPLSEKFPMRSLGMKITFFFFFRTAEREISEMAAGEGFYISVSGSGRCV